MALGEGDDDALDEVMRRLRLKRCLLMASPHSLQKAALLIPSASEEKRPDVEACAADYFLCSCVESSLSYDLLNEQIVRCAPFDSFDLESNVKVSFQSIKLFHYPFTSLLSLSDRRFESYLNVFSN